MLYKVNCIFGNITVRDSPHSRIATLDSSPQLVNIMIRLATFLKTVFSTHTPTLSLVLLMISGISALSPDKDDFRPKLQMEKHCEQSYIPLTEKGVFERIELPLFLNLNSNSADYFKIVDNNVKVGLEAENIIVESINSSVPHCSCDLSGSLPDINAGTGTTYSSLGLPSNYVLTNKCLAILGVLIIDMNVTFEDGSILTGGNTKIIVESGNTLFLKNVNEDGGVHSGQCEVLWKGIEVESGATLNISYSIIQDAINAVSLYSGSTHRIQNSHFRRNLVGILVPDGQTLPVVINQSAALLGNTFDSHLVLSSYMFPYFDGTSLVYPTKPYAGIEIHDATFILGSPSSGFVANEFRLVENGIIGVGANLSIYDVEMDDISEMPQAINATPIKGFGVHTSSTLLRVERSKFIDVTTGVAAITPTGSSFIGSNEFEDNYGGVTAVQGGLTVFENSFKNYEARAVYLDNINGLVAKNSFRAPTSFSVVPSVGIGWTNTPGYSTTTYAGKIEENNFWTLGIYGMGIQLSNSNNFRIQDNSLIYDPGYIPNGPTGILLNNAPRNDVKYNLISGSSSSFGIRTLQSVNNLYCCNTMDGLKGAMAFSGACNSSKIKFNEFGNTVQSSFLCGPGTLIGGQPHYKNSWIGTFSSPPPSVAHAKHDGTAIFIASSLFEVNTCTAPLFPPTILPAQSCPGSGSDWFRFSSNSDITNCGNDINCAYSEDGGEEEMMINENDMRYLNGDYSEEEYADMVEWQMGKDLYQKLLRDNSLVNYHEDVATFYNSSQNTAMGQLVQINESLREAGAIPGITQDAIEALVNEIEELMTDLSNVDAEMLGELSPEEFNDLSGERIDILTEINALQADMSDLMSVYRTSAHASYSSLASLNSSINATSDIEIMEKEVNALLLESLIYPEYVYDQEEKDYLFSVANLCHLQYGSVIFVARSLFLRSENHYFRG